MDVESRARLLQAAAYGVCVVCGAIRAVETESEFSRAHVQHDDVEYEIVDEVHIMRLVCPNGHEQNAWTHA